MNVRLRAGLADAKVSYRDTGAPVGGFFVYRIYGEDGAPIYFGQTANPEQRFRSHASRPGIAGVAAAIVIEEHDSREAAELTERRHIGIEAPRLNLHGIVTPDDAKYRDEDLAKLARKYGAAWMAERLAACARRRAALCGCRECQENRP